jgi:hypothetical protein
MKRAHLVHKKEEWRLQAEGGSTIKAFGNATKAEAISKSARLMEGTGTSVKIHKLDGTIGEERSYPRSADPKRSPG